MSTLARHVAGPAKRYVRKSGSRVIQPNNPSTNVTEALLLENSLWQFSLRVYAIPEVAAECLELQRMRSINVNMLLFCCWAAVSRSAALSATDIQAIESAIEVWHMRAVLPLRDIRDRLKLISEMKHAEVETFRRRILADELRAEQIEQALLYQQAERLSLRKSTALAGIVVRENIDRLCSLAPVPQPAEAPIQVAALIAASLGAEDKPEQL